MRRRSFNERGEIIHLPKNLEDHDWEYFGDANSELARRRAELELERFERRENQLKRKEETENLVAVAKVGGGILAVVAGLFIVVGIISFIVANIGPLIIIALILYFLTGAARKK